MSNDDHPQLVWSSEDNAALARAVAHRRLRLERHKAQLCPDCGEGHYPYGSDPRQAISISKQAERDRYAAYQRAVNRLGRLLTRAFGADEPTAADQNASALFALGGHESVTAFWNEHPHADRRGARMTKLYELAKWHIRLPNGETPQRLCARPGCGSTRVRFEPGRTAYASCDGFDDDSRNGDVILCADCAAEYHAMWDDMWDDYRSSQGV